MIASATIVRHAWHDSKVVGAKADYKRADYIIPRTRRECGIDKFELETSPPPFKPSIVRNLIGAIISAVAA